MIIEPGLRGVAELVVSRQNLASYTGNLGAEVLSTHQVVLLMEQASRNAIAGRLPEGRISVGTEARVRHFAATPIGVGVRAESELSAFEEGRMVFKVVVNDEFQKIAEGENVQILVSVQSFLDRVRRKMKPQRD